MKTGDVAQSQDPSQGRVGIQPWEKLILKYAESSSQCTTVPQDWLKSRMVEGIWEGESMSTDYVAALAAHDRLCAGNCRAARAEAAAVGMRMWGPAGFMVLLNTIYLRLPCDVMHSC